MTEREAMEMKHVWIIVFAGQKQKLKEFSESLGEGNYEDEKGFFRKFWK